jgi:hypothetical protein
MLIRLQAVLVATVIGGLGTPPSMAQGEEAEPAPVTEAPVTGTTSKVIKPVTILTAAQKEALRKLCAQAAYRSADKCKGIAPQPPAASN